jgi:hypothetical protein
MLSEYHAAPRSKKSSPVWKAPPRKVLFVRYHLLITLKVVFVTVEGSISSDFTKLLSAASSSAGVTLRPRIVLLKTVPSFSWYSRRLLNIM